MTSRVFRANEMNKVKLDSNETYISETYPTTLIRAIYVRNYSSLKEVLRRFDITPVQWRVLANLQEFDGQNLNALAERSYTDRTNLSRAVSALEKAGLVKKNREITDQRNILVHLTEKGKKKFRTACPAVKKLDNESIKDFSPAEIATLMDFLNRLKESSYRTRRLDQLVRVESRI